MKDRLPFRARRMAIKHHSEYVSNDYTDLIRANGILIGMSHKGNSWGLRVVLEYANS
jgi:transposase InsO family protein